MMPPKQTNYISCGYFRVIAANNPKKYLQSVDSRLLQVNIQVFTAYKSYSPNQMDLFSNLKLASEDFYNFIKCLGKIIRVIFCPSFPAQCKEPNHQVSYRILCLSNT